MSEQIARRTYAELEAEIVRLSKVIDALMLRVEREDEGEGGRAYAHFQAAATLEGVVRERTESLEQALAELERSNRDLRAAKQAADAANEAKTRFLATMSHEIRTPMNGVMGALELLARTRLTPRQERLVSTTGQASKQLLRVINDVLDFSRLDNSDLELHFAAFSPRAIVQGVVDLHRERAASKGLVLGLELDSRVPVEVSGDAGRVRQVLNNLVDNAIKFTESGRVSVELDLEGTGRWGVGLRFSVRDTGRGVADEERERIFHSFHQADTSTTREIGGTGLGLAIAKRLVEQMGGTIAVESTRDVGSTFTARIQFSWPEEGTESVAAVVGDERAQAPEVPLGVEPRTEETGARVLVADDNEINLDYLRDALELWGHVPTLVLDGQEAVDVSQQSSFHLILMDWRMPRMDGLTATRRIRELEAADPSQPHVPIVALTANALAGDREQCLLAGMDDFLGKPFTLDQLQQMVERWLPSRFRS